MYSILQLYNKIISVSRVGEFYIEFEEDTFLLIPILSLDGNLLA